jgi:hypothetical protein
MIEKVLDALQRLFSNPLPVVMALVALVCAVAAANPHLRPPQRLASGAVAIISAGVAWYMIRVLHLL